MYGDVAGGDQLRLEPPIWYVRWIPRYFLSSLPPTRTGCSCFHTSYPKIRSLMSDGCRNKVKWSPSTPSRWDLTLVWMSLYTNTMSLLSFAQLFIRDGVESHITNPRGQHLANLSIIFACLSFTFVSCRLWTRYFINKSVGIDDYLIVPATVNKEPYRSIPAPQLTIIGFGNHNGGLL